MSALSRATFCPIHAITHIPPPPTPYTQTNASQCAHNAHPLPSSPSSSNESCCDLKVLMEGCVCEWGGNRRLASYDQTTHTVGPPQSSIIISRNATEGNTCLRAINEGQQLMPSPGSTAWRWARASCCPSQATQTRHIWACVQGTLELQIPPCPSP